jgi:hypothetical protein
MKLENRMAGAGLSFGASLQIKLFKWPIAGPITMRQAVSAI